MKTHVQAWNASALCLAATARTHCLYFMLTKFTEVISGFFCLSYCCSIALQSFSGIYFMRVVYTPDNHRHQRPGHSRCNGQAMCPVRFDQHP